MDSWPTKIDNVANSGITAKSCNIKIEKDPCPCMVLTWRFSSKICILNAVEERANPNPEIKAMDQLSPTRVPMNINNVPVRRTCISPSPNIVPRSFHNLAGASSRPIKNNKKHLAQKNAKYKLGLGY